MQDTITPGMRALARKVVAQEVIRERGDYRSDGTRETFAALAETAPDWMTDLAREAHGEFMPDDWRYEWIANPRDLAIIDPDAFEPLVGADS